MNGKSLMGLDKQYSTNLERLHQLMRCHMRVFQMFKRRARDDDVKSLTPCNICQLVQISDNVYINSWSYICSQVTGSMRHPGVMLGGTIRNRSHCTQFKDMRIFNTLAAIYEIVHKHVTIWSFRFQLIQF